VAKSQDELALLPLETYQGGLILPARKIKPDQTRKAEEEGHQYQHESSQQSYKYPEAQFNKYLENDIQQQYKGYLQAVADVSGSKIKTGLLPEIHAAMAATVIHLCKMAKVVRVTGLKNLCFKALRAAVGENAAKDTHEQNYSRTKHVLIAIFAAVISVNNLTISFGGEPLFEEISFLINPKDRVGLAGKNGAGKSTLLKILAGLQSYDSGEVVKPGNCTIGYLPQDMSHNLGKTVFDEAASSFVEVKAIEKKIADINHQLETRTDYESEGYMKLLHDLHDLGERMNLLGGYSLDADIETTLLGLGFERSDFTRLMDEFSGGWRMRVELAKLLLQRPNVLLLDEPTNHLDIESIQWLEDFLKNYYGAVVMVSHDRAFLDSITTRTIEITMGRIYDYKANYSKYLVMRKERREQQQAAKKNQDRYIEKTQVLIDKFRAKKDKAAFAQSLIKKLEKLEIVEVDDEDTARIHFRFPPAPRSGKIVVEARQVKKQYGDKVIFSDVDFMIEREDKVAFVGRNGEGKSTMIKLISGVEKGEGNLTIGANVSIGYFAQNQAETLDGSKTVFDTIDEVAVGEVRKAVRTLLGSFLFSGDDVDKR